MSGDGRANIAFTSPPRPALGTVPKDRPRQTPADWGLPRHRPRVTPETGEGERDTKGKIHKTRSDCFLMPPEDHFS